MSKLKNKLLILFITVLFLSGCSIEFYNPSDSYPQNNNKSESISNIINDSDYKGIINYANDTQVELSSEAIYKKGVSSSVYIIAYGIESTYLGSGVFFSEDTNDDGYAYLFTNAHVVIGASSFEIVYSNYKKDLAKLIGYNTLEDIAILAVKKNDNYTIPTIKTSNELEVASEVLTIGTPIDIDYSFTATKGILSKINAPVTSTYDENYTLFLLQIDASLNSGNSGGPLFDKYGNLIGLNTMKIIYDENYTSVDDFNFSIPIDRAIFIANKIFNKIDYKKGSLGITITDIVDMQISQKELSNITLDYGLYVYDVLETSDAYNKILTGDIITQINHKSFYTKNEFQRELYQFAQNDFITLTVFRNNEYLDFTITLK